MDDESVERAERAERWLDRGYRWSVGLLIVSSVAWLVFTAVSVTLVVAEEAGPEVAIRTLTVLLAVVTLGALFVGLAGLVLRGQRTIIHLLRRFASEGVDYARGYADAMEHKQANPLRSVHDR